MSMDDAGADVLAVIQRIHPAWLEGPVDAITATLLPCFDEAVVMTYTLNDQTYTESGHDLLVFTQSGGEWHVMRRALVPPSS